MESKFIGHHLSLEDLGIPYDAELGTWKLTAQSRLDSKTIDIDVSIPTETGLTLQIEQTEYSTRDIVTITGIGQTDASRLQIKIINVKVDIISYENKNILRYG